MIHCYHPISQLLNIFLRGAIVTEENQNRNWVDHDRQRRTEDKIENLRCELTHVKAQVDVIRWLVIAALGLNNPISSNLIQNEVLPAVEQSLGHLTPHHVSFAHPYHERLD